MKTHMAITAIMMFLLIMGISHYASADPMVITGNAINQSSTGNTEASLNSTAVSDSIIRNGAAGNTINATGNLALLSNNIIYQTSVGNHVATMVATSVNNSRVENYATGNNISLF